MLRRARQTSSLTGLAVLVAVAPAGAAPAALVNNPALTEAEPDDSPEPFTAGDRLRAEVAINVPFAVGLLPTASGGFGGSAGLRWERVTLSVEGRFLLPFASFKVGEKEEAGAALAMGLITMCRPTEFFSLCILAEAGRFVTHPAPPGLLQNEDAHAFTAGFGGRAAGLWQFDNGGYLKAFVEIDMAAIQPRFRFNLEDVWAMPLAGVVFGLELSAVLNQPLRWAPRWAQRKALAASSP